MEPIWTGISRRISDRHVSLPKRLVGYIYRFHSSKAFGYFHPPHPSWSGSRWVLRHLICCTESSYSYRSFIDPRQSYVLARTSSPESLEESLCVIVHVPREALTFCPTTFVNKKLFLLTYLLK